jgi:hypothetical protein
MSVSSTRIRDDTDDGWREALSADHGLALLLLKTRDHPVHGRHHRGLAEVVPGGGHDRGLLGDAFALRLDRGLLHLELGLGLLEDLVGDQLFLVHLLLALERLPALLEVGEGAIQVGPGRGEAGF